MNMTKAKGMTCPKFLKTFNTEDFTFEQIKAATKRQSSHIKYWIKKLELNGQLIVTKTIDPTTTLVTEYYRMISTVPVDPNVPVATPEVATNVPVATVSQKNTSLDDNTIYVSATIPKMGLTVANMEISQFCALLDAVIKTKKG